MNWRHIDNMMVSWSIEQIQTQINNGTLEPPIFAMAGQYNAWRIRMQDKLMAEAHRNGWAQESGTIVIGFDPKEEDTAYDPSNELNDDLGHYDKLVKKKK
jgi:hypothetical protein